MAGAYELLQAAGVAPHDQHPLIRAAATTPILGVPDASSLLAELGPAAAPALARLSVHGWMPIQRLAAFNALVERPDVPLPLLAEVFAAGIRDSDWPTRQNVVQRMAADSSRLFAVLGAL